MLTLQQPQNSPSFNMYNNVNSLKHLSSLHHYRSTLTKLRSERSGVSIPQGARVISLLHKVQTSSGVITTWAWGSFLRVKWRAVTVSTHIDVVLRLRKSGATPLRPFIAWTETTLRFNLHRCNLTQETFSRRMADSFWNILYMFLRVWCNFSAILYNWYVWTDTQTDPLSL